MQSSKLHMWKRYTICNYRRYMKGVLSMVKNGILRGKESDLGAEPPRIRLCWVPPPPPPPRGKRLGLGRTNKVDIIDKVKKDLCDLVYYYTETSIFYYIATPTVCFVLVIHDLRDSGVWIFCNLVILVRRWNVSLCAWTARGFKPRPSREN